MAQKSLAVRYRPMTFDDVVEQSVIKDILKYQVETGTHKNCYLFCGGAGTGKTTCARIFANEINNGKGTTIEIDAASNNGVEQVREIIDNSKFKSIDSEYKVYILDEVHMLSTGAWNAMLKLIEEPPASTIFIMCTTDPQKIPATILSRVQRYDFQRITYNAIVARLAHIIDCENAERAAAADPEWAYDYEQEALHYIAKMSEGGMRDAITLLDKCISYSSSITLKNVVDTLGTTDYSVMFDLTDAILDMKTADAIKIIEEVHRSGADLKQFVKSYMSFMLDLCKYEVLQGFEYLQLPATHSEQLSEYGGEDFDVFQTILDGLVALNAAIKWDTSPKTLIEATVMSWCKEED